MSKTFLLTLAAVTVTSAAMAQTLPSGGNAPQKAMVHLQQVGSSGVYGQIWFVEEGRGVRVEGEIRGLTPGEHGFHIHEFGDCSSPDAKSAGGHYNPRGHKHGAQDGKKRHVGDLGNITADENGVAKIDFVDRKIKLSGKKDLIQGRGVIVHAKADDLSSQPTGAAGGRVACGIIGAH